MKPNVLFIIIDSFHAEKFYGDKKTSVTPNLDLLINQGAYFSNSITCAPSTLPSVGSIFTSRYPFESTIRNDENFVFNSEISNYVNELKTNGYTTYSFIPKILDHYGFSNLFDHTKTFESNRSLYDDGDNILYQLSNDMEKPWFFYLHLFDLHGYKKFDENEKVKKFHNIQYGINKYEQMISALDVWLGKIIDKINLENTLIIFTADHATDDANYTEKLQKYKKNIRSYNPNLMVKSSIKFGKKTPKFLSPIKTKLKNKFLEKRTATLSKKKNDELEAIQNMDLSPYQKRIMKNAVKTTYHIYDDRLKIPLLFAGYNVPKNVIVQNQVQSVDIFPTIFEIIGLSFSAEIRGRSLFPLLSNQEMDEVPAFLESATNHTDIMDVNVVGLRTPKFKYFRNRHDPNSNVNLFDLYNDPHEEQNIASENASLINKMEKSLFELNKNGNFSFQENITTTTNDEQTEQITAELKKMGYI